MRTCAPRCNALGRLWRPERQRRAAAARRATPARRFGGRRPTALPPKKSGPPKSWPTGSPGSASSPSKFENNSGRLLARAILARAFSLQKNWYSPLWMRRTLGQGSAIMEMVVQKVFPDHVRVRFPACSVEYLFCRDGTRLCVSMYTEQPTPRMEERARLAALSEFSKHAHERPQTEVRLRSITREGSPC